MENVELEMGLLLRQKVIAAAKPYEAFEDTVIRLLLAGVDAANNVNLRTLKRSVKRWPEPTEAVMEERRRALYRELGFSADEYEDLFGDDSERAEDNNPANWKHERDFKYGIARAAVMNLLHRKKKGSKFALRTLLYKACPTISNLPHPVYSKLEKTLFESRHFMRHVSFSKSSRCYDLIIHKVT